MKKLTALVFALGMFAVSSTPLLAAKCTQGDIVVEGETCGVVAGSCQCTDGEN